MNCTNSILSRLPGAPDGNGYGDLALAGASKQDWQAAVAVAWAIRGDRKKTFEYLEEAFTHEDTELILCIRYPAFDSMRSDPKYANLMRQLGLPEYTIDFGFCMSGLLIGIAK